MTPRELGAAAAASAPPLTDDQVEQAARLLAGVDDPVPASEGEARAGAV